MGCVLSSSTVSPHKDRANIELHSEAVIKRDRMPESNDFGDTLRGCNQAGSEMHVDTVIWRVWRCTRRPWLSEFGDALGGRDWTRLEMYLEAGMEQVCRCTWMPWSSEVGEVLEGGQPGGGSLGRRCNRSWDSIHGLTCNCAKLENSLLHGLRRDKRLAVSGMQSIIWWCSTPCMQ